MKKGKEEQRKAELTIEKLQIIDNPEAAIAMQEKPAKRMTMVWICLNCWFDIVPLKGEGSAIV
jgi:hypothetical protein